MRHNDTLELESNVRSYSRKFPLVFHSAEGSKIYDRDGNSFIDLLSGCGSLNYGHNHPALKNALIKYIDQNGITMSLDLFTGSRISFLNALREIILEPRGLQYRVQFPGPTGANAVEAAIKLARKATGRSNIIAFTNAFHGCSLGALAMTGARHHRSSSNPLLSGCFRIPYDGYLGDEIDTSDYLEQLLSDASSGCDLPAAIILETVQGEGGLSSAQEKWLKRIQSIAEKHCILLIIDDVQAGCGRCGSYFSFEESGIRPDIICLAKSLSGLGLPMSVVLLRKDLDVWSPGEHNGTFRGNNYAFITATKSLQEFWSDSNLISGILDRAKLLDDALSSLCSKHDVVPKGRGLMRGIRLANGQLAASVQNACFQDRLILETCGPDDEVVKLMPALNIPIQELKSAIATIAASLDDVLTPNCEVKHIGDPKDLEATVQ